MPRSKRTSLPGFLQHVSQRGNNSQAVFQHRQDYQFFINLLANTSKHFNVAIHAYVLLPDHFHFMVTPDTTDGLSLMMQAIGRRYVAYFNNRYQRTGTLWEGRFKSTMIQAQSHALNCFHMLDTHASRSGIARYTGEYPWSSYGALALGMENELLLPHPMYKALSEHAVQRQARYQARCRRPLPESFVGDLSACTSSGVPLGDEFFKKSIERNLGIEFGYIRRGRPRKDNAYG